MRKRFLASLLSLALVLTLLPTSAFAIGTTTDSLSSLTPSAKYFSLYGAETSQETACIVLNKTATDNDNGTYTVTLSATVNGYESIEPQKPEVVFAIDRSSSMNYCTRTDHAHADGARCNVTWEDQSQSRGYISIDAVITMAEMLTNAGIEYKFVTFGNTAETTDLDGLKAVQNTTNVKGATNLYAGVETALSAFSDESDSKKVLIIVADGEATVANDAGEFYPNDLAAGFKDSGGEIYTVGFAFTGGEFSEFFALANDGSHIFDVSNAEDLDFSMEEIRRNIVAMINDPLGEDVSLVGDVNFTLNGVEAGSVSTTNDVISWTKDDGLNGTVTLKYTVKINNYGSLTAGSYEIPLNGVASFNYTYEGNFHALQFPKPIATLEIATLHVSYVDENNNPVTVIDPIAPEWVDVNKSSPFTATFPSVNDEITATDGETTYTVQRVFGAPDGSLEAKAYNVKIVLTKDKDEPGPSAEEVTPNTHTVTYNLNGGESGSVNYDPVTVTHAAEHTVKVAPKKNGYSFTGWSDGDTAYQPDTTIYVLSDIDLTAQWQSVSQDQDEPPPCPPPD